MSTGRPAEVDGAGGAMASPALREARGEAPADSRALVAIDLGAESCRVSLLRWRPGGVPHIELVHRFANGAVQRPDGLRWDLGCILHGLEQGLRTSAERAPEGIRSVAVDGWGVDYVRLGEDGRPLADPFCYRDERTEAAVASLHRRVSAARMRELTGLQQLPLNTVYQFEADGPELRRRPWLQLPEYVLHWLGGRAVAERTNATHTQMIGLDGRWSAEILAALGLTTEAMPELVEAGTRLGRLRGPLAELPAFAQTELIAPCCHDTAAAIAAIPDGGDDWAYLSSGTWSLVGALIPEPVNTEAARRENFTNLGGADGTVCFHKNVNGMWLLRQCMESWAEAGTKLEIGSLVEAAATVPGREYVLEVDDPDLLHQGGMPERINAQLRRRGLPELDPSPGGAPAMASFLFHSLAARYGKVLRDVAEITGKRLRKLYIMGGGSQNEVLNRLTAEATGLEVIRAGTECSTVGNFAVQLATLEATPGARPSSAWAAKLSNHAKA